MPRKKRPLDRDGGVLRDASLIVIASEDTYAVEDYFRRFRTRKVQFKVIPTEDGRSSPDDVASRLDDFKREVQTQPGDQFWLCIDRDHWANSGHIKNLAQVLQHCRQAEYQVAISNPCFELWLLLHFEDAKPANGCNCGEIASRLSAVAGGYDKTAVDRLPIQAAMVHDAIARAKALDIDPSPIPESVLTRVYLILEVLLAREAIDLE
jgi:hypothetical protein